MTKKRLELLIKFHKEASNYIQGEALRKDKLRKIVSLNEYYRREISKDKHRRDDWPGCGGVI
jgi:hypothetical protein